MTTFEQIQDALNTAARGISNLTITATRANSELVSITYRSLDAALNAAKALDDQRKEAEKQKTEKPEATDEEGGESKCSTPKN